MPDTLDANNIEQNHAFDLIAKTNKSFFLTGRAGTGKTTFLKSVQETVKKNFIVLAPTGIAAINAGGQTIHSFFGFDFGVLGPKRMGQMNLNKRVLVQNIDTIIIDEVSMLRCDLLDAVDRMLRDCTNSSRPFGGIQMVFVGDMFQLPPVVTGEDVATMESLYGSGPAYFYKAHCLKHEKLPKIEFQKVYRQSDEEFIKMLDRIRMGKQFHSDLKTINEHVQAGGSFNDDDMRITLTCYKEDAKAINEVRLDELPGEPKAFEATYEGKVSKQLKDIVDETLVLKENAQVMFLRNDPFRRWANGTIARVIELEDDMILVQLPDGSIQGVGKETWDSIEYEYDPVAKKCVKNVVGSVMQYPLRLAWAITIHKSQSLTFDKVNIDFGRGAFACGQAYVALSRVRSLAGLKLASPIEKRSIRVSTEALMFASSFNDKEMISSEIAVGEAIRDFERRDDYDGAAKCLFAMCSEEAHHGNVRKAYDLLNRTLSAVADDECLFGQKWDRLPNNSKESILLNAAGLLYSGQTEESIRLLRIVTASYPAFNALYLLARALEIQKKWETAEELYDRMGKVLADNLEKGLDSPAFRKLRYRRAILDESNYSGQGFLEIVRLIAENPKYAKYHLVLRQMLAKSKDKFDFEEGEENTLITAFFDGSISEKKFLKMLQKERFTKSKAWHGYLESIKTLNPVSRPEDVNDN